uniref:Uncharacterized protein n=1 Tax=Cacopsylla melanoneura TaxID=428564 RepID=A0A8D8RGU1_9HEMI
MKTSWCLNYIARFCYPWEWSPWKSWVLVVYSSPPLLPPLHLPHYHLKKICHTPPSTVWYHGTKLTLVQMLTWTLMFQAHTHSATYHICPVPKPQLLQSPFLLLLHLFLSFPPPLLSLDRNFSSASSSGTPFPWSSEWSWSGLQLHCQTSSCETEQDWGYSLVRRARGY